MTHKDKQFSIDDAFESDTNDDSTKLYGSITRNPLKKNNNNVDKDGLASVDSVYISLQMPSKKDNNSSIRSGQLMKIPEDALSKDSDSLIDDISYAEQFNPENGWWNHPKVRRNWRIVLAAFALLFIGIGLIVAGIFMYLFPQIGIPGFVFFITGAFFFIPGVYHVVFIYFASQGRQGFHFYNLPVFK